MKKVAIDISRNHALRGYAAWTLRVPADTERPGGIPPAGAFGRGGTSSIHHFIRRFEVCHKLMSEREKNLLQQITIGMPEQSWQRYHLLITKLEAETLQPDEQQELSQIIEQREEANVRRIDALIKLAQLRNSTLDALIDELDVRPALYI